MPYTASHIPEANTKQILIDLKDSRDDDVDREVLLDEIIVELERFLNECIVVVPEPE